MSKKRYSKKKNINAKRNTKSYTGFFAFPSKPSDRENIIEKSIELINSQESTNNFRITSWTNIRKTSSRIISNILECIEKSDVLIADISGLNPNVLFEVGYAFGAGKKLLLFIQGFSTLERHKDMSDIELINGLNIEPYENWEQLAQKILSNIPDIFVNREPEINKFGYNSLNAIQQQDKGFFLKGITNHQNGIFALSCFRSIFPNCVVDDWNEDVSQTLTFYIKEVEKSSGIVALFIDKDWDYSQKVNARFSFICGMALAMKKKVLMIGLPGFKSPLDYRDIMITSNSEDIIKRTINDRFSSNHAVPTAKLLSPDLLQSGQELGIIKNDSSNKKEQEITVIQNKSKNSPKKNITKEDKEIILLDVDIGNSIAENEEHELYEYYIETGQFHQARTSKQAIVVGNKGSGKTACFYQVRDYIKENNSKNLICEIKPSDYKMERFLGSLRLLKEGEGLIGHVLENVWKTIVYSNIIDTLYKEIKAYPVYVELKSPEKSLLTFAEKHIELINSPFEQKLEKACKWLHDAELDVDNFSKKIHEEFLSHAKTVMQPILSQRSKIVILLDNLDKAWEINSNLRLQAQLFFNLLGIHRRLHSDFDIDNVSVLIFMRRNIFEYILENVAREPDKLKAEAIELVWSDKEVLLRVLEERFKIASSNWGLEIDDPWTTFFRWENKDVSIKDWLYNSVLPRPRDLINFIQKAIELAISHNHAEIQEGDLENASISYSGFALEQIIAEYKVESPWISDFLNSFIGEFHTFKFDELVKKIKSHTDEVLNRDVIINRIITLVSINFMGVKLNGSPIIYAYNIQECSKLSSIIRNNTLNKNALFIIHPVFYKHLNINTIKPKRTWSNFLGNIKAFTLLEEDGTY